MDINRLTQKSIAAVQDAQSIASRNTNQQVDQQHLMKALLDQKLIAELITRMGKDKDAFDAAPAADGTALLPGVVSRKKQFIPKVMDAYQQL